MLGKNHVTNIMRQRFSNTVPREMRPQRDETISNAYCIDSFPKQSNIQVTVYVTSTERSGKF